MKKTLFIVILLLANVLVNAQTKDLPNSIGIVGGLIQYNGDLGQGFYNGNTKPFGGLGYARYINGHFDFVFNATMGRWGYKEENNVEFDTKMLQANVQFRIKLLNSDSNKLVPYIFAGIGAADYSDYELKATTTGAVINNPDGNGTDLFVPYGVGLQYRLTERLNISLQETFAYTDHDSRDAEVRLYNESFLMHTIGLSYNFGSGKDTDNDGVKDNKDKCPETPTGVKVDEKGCPLDRDADMVYDYLDSCPDTKGVIALHGCPDKDGDGIADKEDQCPDEAGTLATKGCPDKDGDRVIDKEDHCPDYAGSLQNQGCPDRDEDGVVDVEDNCPDERGTTFMHGCADTDKDGVADNVDKCPNDVGTVANNGCPDQEALPALANLLFASGQFAINKSHQATLDSATKYLKNNPLAKLLVEGYTDNTGDDKINMTISKNRTNAVIKYLKNKGIANNRLEGNSFGETKPVESNDTEEGKAKNRRVELKIIKP